MADFMSALEKASESLFPNTSVTENGAIGLKSTGNKLLDMNFKLSSMRNMSDNEIWSLFLRAYNENPSLAMLWLFFARDIRGGCGERRVFRVVFERFCRENSAVAIRLLSLIPFYGRWDDLIGVFCGDVPCNVREAAFSVIQEQLTDDLGNMKAGKPVSLLAKWMPSTVTSSRDTRRNAERLRAKLGFTPRQYRKTFSSLRRHIGVTEQKMSGGEWDQIDYQTVPSRAAMNYRAAFMRHDYDRYDEYLANVSSGEAKINSGVLYPYDIVHAYKNAHNLDRTLEAQWKALPNTVHEGQSTIVVVDGSGSMYQRVGNTAVTCYDVARSIGLYFAEKLPGQYHHKFITFSENPRFVTFADTLSLYARIALMEEYDECSNTDIEKVFDLVLNTALENHLPQEEIPANILVVSDMEFDEGVCDPDENLFVSIRRKWETSGYKLPRLIFWNVCSRTGTIPIAENENGVTLVSGFSPNIADMVMSGDIDPYNCLVSKLMSDRYLPVMNALKE